MKRGKISCLESIWDDLYKLFTHSSIKYYYYILLIESQRNTRVFLSDNLFKSKYWILCVAATSHLLNTTNFFSFFCIDITGNMEQRTGCYNLLPLRNCREQTKGGCILSTLSEGLHVLPNTLCLPHSKHMSSKFCGWGFVV